MAMFLPSADRRYLEGRAIEFREVEEGANKGVVLEAFGLPENRFDFGEVDILILLPAGYPDTPPDMFYLVPWVKLASKNAYPNAANVAFGYAGKNWQRWSRHNNEWRPGVDGIWTMIKRIEHALENAA